MRRNQVQRLLRIKEFELNHDRLRAAQIETMIAEFDQICADLTQQIQTEEARVRIFDLKHFAYPTVARAARDRRAKIQQTADAFRIELERIRSKVHEMSVDQAAA